MWRWLIVDDPETIARLAHEYRAAMGVLDSGAMPPPAPLSKDVSGEDRILDSALALANKLDKMPAILIPLMPGRPEGKNVVGQVAMWGSILQAV